MAYFILGKRKADFTNDAGQHIVGINVWVSEPIEFNGEGVTVNKHWLNPDKFPYDSIQLNKKCDVLFNSKGKIRDIVY